MHERWRDLLPFFVGGGLSAADHAAVRAHLSECTVCHTAVREWQEIAVAVQTAASERANPLPPLSPVVRANLRRRPTAIQALRSAADLVWAQRVVLAQRSLAAVLLLMLVMGVLMTLRLRDSIPVSLPTLCLVPVVAAVSVAYLYGPETDSAFEIVATTPTSPGTLLLARLTLALGFVASAAALASLLLSATGEAAFGPLVSAWLGPLLLLSALATVLALLWGPLIAAGVTLALWGGVVILLGTELGGRPLIQLSLRPLLQPGWPLFVSQIVIAVLLWSLGWLFLTYDALPARNLEAR